MKAKMIGIICLLILLHAGRLSAEGTDPAVTGVETALNPSAEDTVEDAVTVTVPGRCGLFLQYQDPESGTWKSVVRYRLKGTGKPENITIHYPDQWKKQTNSVWRLWIPASEEWEEFISPEIRITAGNVGNIDLNGSYAAIVRGSDGALIYGKDPEEETANASTTKMMTALVVMEEKPLDEIVTVTAEAAATPYGVMRFEDGQRFYLDDLLHVMLIRSSNDSATALAIHTGGSVEAFAEKMNEKAEELGLEHTSFKNPHGLDEDGHYSCALDLCHLQAACYQYEPYQEIILHSYCAFEDADQTQSYFFYSTDDLLYGSYRERGFLGGKTGYTDNAGRCFCGVFIKDREIYYFAVLGCSSIDQQWRDAKLLMYYIRKYA